MSKSYFHERRQAGAELGQAQLKLGLDFTLLGLAADFCIWAVPGGLTYTGSLNTLDSDILVFNLNIVHSVLK